MAVPTVVFDLDGTLVDTAPDLVATLNVILDREGLPPVGYETARNMVGGGARIMLERGLAVAGTRARACGCSTGWSAISSLTTQPILPTAPLPSQVSRPRSTSSPPTAAA